MSAAEGIRFVKVITEFDESISEMGPFGAKEGLDRQAVMYKLKAALKTVEGRTFRMAFAKQSKQMKEEETFGQFPSKDKLLEMFKKEMNMFRPCYIWRKKSARQRSLPGFWEFPKNRSLELWRL